MVFTNAYAVHPRCVPSRYGILIGKYPARGGVPAEWGDLCDNEQIFAQFLKPTVKKKSMNFLIIPV